MTGHTHVSLNTFSEKLQVMPLIVLLLFLLLLLGVWYSLVLDERRFSPRAVLDESDRKQPRSLVLRAGSPSCQRLGFSVQVGPPSTHTHEVPFMFVCLINRTYFWEQETTDYGRPIAVVLETGLQSPDEGPVLDPDWSSVLRAEVRGCFPAVPSRLCLSQFV